MEKRIESIMVGKASQHPGLWQRLTRLIPCILVDSETEKAQVEMGLAAIVNACPVAHFLQLSPTSLPSKTFIPAPSAEDQKFKHKKLWGTVHIQIITVLKSQLTRRVASRKIKIFHQGSFLRTSENIPDLYFISQAHFSGSLGNQVILGWQGKEGGEQEKLGIWLLQICDKCLNSDFTRQRRKTAQVTVRVGNQVKEEVVHELKADRHCPSKEKRWVGQKSAFFLEQQGWGKGAGSSLARGSWFHDSQIHFAKL